MNIHSRLPCLLLAAASSIPLGIVPGLQAAEWVAEPSVTLRGEYDDNIRLTTLDHDDVWGTILDPSLRLSRRTELWDLNATGRVRAAWYSGDDDLDTVDNFLDLAAERRFERGSLEASAGLANDTTLQNEYLDIDTGLVVNQIDRSRRSARLAGQYMFTEATWVEVSVDYSQVEYDDGLRFGLLDYDYLTPGLRVIHQLNPKTQVFGILSHARVDYDAASELESKTDSLQLGAAYDITEVWKVSGSVGARRTETSSLVPTYVPPAPDYEPFCGLVIACEIIYVPTDAETTGLVYDASLTREFETGSLKLSASQSIVPSSTGSDTETTRLDLTGTRRFSAQLWAQLAVSYYQSDTVGDVTTRADQDRYRIAPSLTWMLDRDLSLRAGYAYTHVKRDIAIDDTADSNMAYVSLGYSWPRMSMSR